MDNNSYENDDLTDNKKSLRKNKFKLIYILFPSLLFICAIFIFILFFSPNIYAYKEEMRNNLSILHSVGLPVYTDKSDIGMVKYEGEWYEAEDYQMISLKRNSGLNFCNKIVEYNKDDVPLIYKNKHKEVLSVLDEYISFVNELKLLDKAVYRTNAALDRVASSLFSSYKDTTASKDSLFESMELTRIYESKNWSEETDLILNKILELEEYFSK